MGGGSFTDRDWKTYSSTRRLTDPGTKTKDIYQSRTLNEDLDPLKFRIREARDSAEHPASTAIILGLDVTGSMSPVLDSVARKGMKTLCEEILKRKPVTDPQICSVGIGDVECDSYPFQASQFESDIRILEHLEKLFLEEGGGGNNHESYILAWYFAKFRTAIDCFEKRGTKGFIITIGDEDCTPKLSKEHLKRFMGESEARDYTAKELYDLVSQEWRIYHIILKEGDNARRRFREVKASWDKVIGPQNVIPLSDHTRLGETIVTLLEVASGKNLVDVAASWGGQTSVIVDSALKNVAPVGARASGVKLDDAI